MSSLGSVRDTEEREFEVGHLPGEGVYAGFVDDDGNYQCLVFRPSSAKRLCDLLWAAADTYSDRKRAAK